MSSFLYDWTPDNKQNIFDSIISDISKRLDSNEQHPINDNFSKFESFIKMYPKILRLSETYKKNPGEFINFFVEVGQETLKRSENILLNEMNEKLKKFVATKDIKLSSEMITQLDSLLSFLKSKNQEVKQTNEVNK